MAIFLTAGIGDWLALESHSLPHASEYYLATPAQAEIAELLHLRDRPKIHKLWLEFGFPCFVSLKHYTAITGQQVEAEDWSIAKQFYRPLTYCGSFLHRADLPALKDYPQLRQPYCVIQPTTTRDKSKPKRELDQQDWQAIEAHLKAHYLLGVVVNDKYTPAPAHLLNLSGKLNILESLSLMKGAGGYLGIDSFLSVFAAQLPLTVFKVKTNRQHCRDWANIYFAPHTSSDFLVNAI